MSSVTQRIRMIKQPKGGYIKVSQFEITQINDGIVLNENENVHGSIVGLVVDYMTRFILTNNKIKAFSISIWGASIAEATVGNNNLTEAKKLLKNIQGLDAQSIFCACKLVTFDFWARNRKCAINANYCRDTNPDEATIQNIRILIERSINFFKLYGNIIKEGFTFEPIQLDADVYINMMKIGKGTYGGYTPTVDSGDGDFLTEDTLWDFKVSRSKPTSKETLQILMYWIMGQHSGQEIYKNITKIGIFNPRFNMVYLLNMKDVPNDIIKTVESEVICYEQL